MTLEVQCTGCALQVSRWRGGRIWGCQEQHSRAITSVRLPAPRTSFSQSLQQSGVMGSRISRSHDPTARGRCSAGDSWSNFSSLQVGHYSKTALWTGGVHREVYVSPPRGSGIIGPGSPRQALRDHSEVNVRNGRIHRAASSRVCSGRGYQMAEIMGE